MTRSTGSCLIKGRAELLAKHGLHLAHGHHKKVHRHKPFSVLLVNLGRKTKMFAKGGSRSRTLARRDPSPKGPFWPSNRR